LAGQWSFAFISERPNASQPVALLQKDDDDLAGLAHTLHITASGSVGLILDSLIPAQANDPGVTNFGFSEVHFGGLMLERENGFLDIFRKKEKTYEKTSVDLVCGSLWINGEPKEDLLKDQPSTISQQPDKSCESALEVGSTKLCGEEGAVKKLLSVASGESALLKHTLAQEDLLNCSSSDFAGPDLSFAFTALDYANALPSFSWQGAQEVPERCVEACAGNPACTSVRVEDIVVGTDGVRSVCAYSATADPAGLKKVWSWQGGSDDASGK